MSPLCSARLQRDRSAKPLAFEKLKRRQSSSIACHSCSVECQIWLGYLSGSHCKTMLKNLLV
jgi:hypothetical protein